MEEFAELYKKGNEAADKNQFIEALSCYTEALAIQPNSERALGSRASVYAKLRLFNESQKDAQKLITAAPKSSKGYVLRATALQHLKQHHECLVLFLKAYEVSGQHDRKLLTRVCEVAAFICVQSGDTAQDDFPNLDRIGDQFDRFRALVEVGKRLYKCGEYLLSIKVILTALQVHCHFNVKNFNDEIIVKAGQLKLPSQKPMQECSSEKSSKLQMGVLSATNICISQVTDCLSEETILIDRRDTISALLTVSQAYVDVYYYPIALIFATESLSLAQEFKIKEYEVKSYVKLVNIYQRMGEFFKVISIIGSLLAVGKDLTERDDFEESEYHKYWNCDVKCRALWNLVSAYKSLGNYAEALCHAKRYLQLIRTTNEESVAEAYGVIGRLELLLGNHQKALDCHKMEMELCKKFSNQPDLAYAFGNVGTVYTALGQYKLAAINHDQHFKLAQNLSDNVSKLASIKQIGDMYMHKEDLTTAIKYYHQHLNIAKMNNMETLQCQSYKLIAVCHLKLSQLHHARHYFDLCMEKAEKEGDAITQFECKITLAAILKCLRQFTQAREYYDEVIPVLEQRLLVGKQLEFTHLNLIDPLIVQLENCYAELQEVLVEIGCSDRALEVAERYHSRTFLNNQHHRQMVKEESMSREKAAELTMEAPLSVRDINDIVNQQSATVVMYSVIDKGYLVWVLAPGKGIIKFHRFQNVYNKEILQDEVKRCLEKIHIHPANNHDHRALPSNLERSFLQVESKEKTLQPEAKEMVPRNDSSMFTPLQLLYNTLWLPIEEIISTVAEGSDIIVVPDAVLRTVPFSCLQDKTGTYLTQRFKIRILSCLRAMTLLDYKEILVDNFSPEDNPDATGSKIFVTGNPEMPEVEYNEKVWSPPSQSLLAEQELRTFASLLGVEPVTGGQATKDKVLQTLPCSSVAHIATYGSFREATLVLSPFHQHSTSYPKEDSYLITLQDIAKLKSKAKLVVLNSCFGCTFQYLQQRQMSFDLPMSFLAAGVTAVVIPLWSVPQPATIIFFYRFYSALEKGDKVSEALRYAQEELMATGVFSAPVYWSSFVMLGFDTTVELPRFRHQMLDQLLHQETQIMSSTRFPKLLDHTEAPTLQKVSLLQSVLSELILYSDIDVLSALRDTAFLALSMIKAYKLPSDEVLMRTRISSDVLLAPGAKELLALMGFDFQMKELSPRDPFVVFPHWDIDSTLQTSANLLELICDTLSVSPNAAHPLAKVIAKPWSYETLTKIENMFRISTKFPERIMKTDDVLIQFLWSDSDSQRYLAAIGFYVMGDSLLFDKTTQNQGLLRCAHQIIVTLLAYYEKVRPPIHSSHVNKALVSTPFMSKEPNEDEAKQRISLGEKIQYINKEFAAHVKRANFWHAQLLKQQSKPGPTLPVIGRPKEETLLNASPSRKLHSLKVKVLPGGSPSCDRVPVNEAKGVSVSTTREQRNDIYRIYADRYDNIAMRKRLEIRQLFM